MSRQDSMQLNLTSEPECLPQVRAKVQGWAREHNWTDQQVGEIVLALDEAVTNVIRHAYGGRPRQRIIVYAEMVNDPECGEGLEIRVRDFGQQVDPAEICGRALQDVRPGGLGVHIIKAMNSAVRYERAEGGGMLLTMRKYRTHTAECGGRAERPV